MYGAAQPSAVAETRASLGIFDIHAVIDKKEACRLLAVVSCDALFGVG